MCDLGFLVPMILQRREENFRRVISKANFPDLNHVSSINGLTPMHFAVMWPTALKMLVERGSSVNVEDKYGRRPIHLAVALGLASSVDCLIGADCALFTPPDHRSLLETAMMLTGSERRHILDALTVALNDRHTRLIDRAISLLPGLDFSEFNIVEGQKKERLAPRIREVLLSRGFTVPEVLELDDKSVYNVADMHGSIRMTTDVADTLWSAGFKDINEPNEDGLTPFLQNWFCANFSMIAWFAKKGVSFSSRHRDASLSGLHFYAVRIQYPGAEFSHDQGAVPTDEYCMAYIQKEMGIPHDECTCPCSPSGCSPVKFLCRSNYQSASRRVRFRKWLEKVKPEPKLRQQYVIEVTRYLLFDFLGCKHSCCVLGQEGSIETKRYRKDDASVYAESEYESWSRFSRFRKDGLPRPRRSATSEEDAEMLEKLLDTYMSKCDEMPRPEAMLPEEQPFCYVDWIVERYEAERAIQELY